MDTNRSVGGGFVDGFAYFYRNAWNYNALANGVYTAKSLGIPVGVVLVVGMLVSCLLSSLAVAFVGTIGLWDSLRRIWLVALQAVTIDIS